MTTEQATRPPRTMPGLRAPRRDRHPDGEQGGDERAEEGHPHGQDDPVDDDPDARGQAHHVGDDDGGEDDAGCLEGSLLHWRSPMGGGRSRPCRPLR